MATLSKRPRRTVRRQADAMVWSAGRHRPVIVALHPDGVIGLRLYQTRKEVFINAADAYRRAVAEEAAIRRATRKKAK